MKKNVLPNEMRFPIELLSFVVVVSVVIVCQFSWQAWKFYKTTEMFEKHDLRLAGLGGKIIHLDEVLTMSARMAASTGDLKWEKRYRHFDPILDKTIKEAVAMFVETEVPKKSAMSTDAANIKLVEMEYQSFDLVRQNRKDEALALLNSPEYEDLKKIYAHGMSDIMQSLEENITANVKKSRNRIFLTLVISCFVILFWIVSWIVLLKVLRRWQINLTENNQKLAQLSDATQISVYDLLQQNTDGIVIIDNDGTVLFMNIAAEALFNRRMADMAGKDFGYSFLSDESMEIQIVRSAGKAAFGDMKTSRINWEGRPAYIAIVRDITERKSLQAQLFQSQKMEAVGQLAGGVAHDFNNLLTVINGYAGILLEQISDTDPAREPLDEIRKSGERASALTKQLLAFSRKQIISPRVVDLNALIQNSEKMLRRLIGEDIELSILPAPNLGLVHADPLQVEQVIMNLAVNARDAMPKGGKLFIETTNLDLGREYIRSHAYVDDGQYVMLSVTDTGLGMTPEIKARIFEPFFTTKGLSKGTGLGLATCYGIIKQNGGHIEVYSEPGHGTTFKVYFSRTDKTAETVPKTVPLASGGTETILLVEDEEAVRNFALLVLRKHGYNVIPATNGEDALTVLTEHKDKKVDLLLTDVVMPKMSGRELLEKIKDTKQSPKVLFVSGYTEEVVLRHKIQDQSVNFLQKPFTVDSLLSKVRAVLDNSSVGAG